MAVPAPIKCYTDLFLAAKDTAEDGGLVLTNLDLSYLGVHSIWTNNLGWRPTFA